MKTSNSLVSTCRYCRYYKSEGRRGGTCQLLDGAVHAGWKACHLAIAAFAPSWENLEDMMNLPDAMPVVTVRPLTCEISQSSVESNQAINYRANTQLDRCSASV
ncbi:hypothetical protein [Chlorogloea sp. CCALA 695]|uniref:hypothetical protein n=1 Tax=Chlorogloea sp. CCALA 695 TaxID=2107693 RepID=UPI000D074335|nr:hypothetical protein [Chlorogloea sp. CCALA 695]PSB34580.1 hypothetical protein C7B70_03750 [Chlorogloea sp. CCALA 695]